MLKPISLILLLSQLCLAQIIVNPRRALVINPPPSGPLSTGYTLPTKAETVAEDVWADGTAGDWQNPLNVFGTGEASIIDNGWDAADKSEVLKAYDFQFAIPTGATIVGVQCRITCRASVTNTTIGLVQILDEFRARVGTNLAETPVAITATSAAYVFGASDNLWGNALDEIWVENANFGVGVGMINGTNNADAYIDIIELNVYYTTE